MQANNSEVYEVERLDDFNWKEVEIDGRPAVVQSYNVYWLNYNLPTREVAANITAANILIFWDTAKKAVKAFDKAKGRGYNRTEANQVARYRKSLKFAEELRELDLPGVVAPGDDGFPAEFLPQEEAIVVVEENMVEEDMDDTAHDADVSDDDVPGSSSVGFSVDKVDYIESYRWKEVEGSTDIEQTYRVHFAHSNEVRRMDHRDIAPDLIKAYWNSVKASMAERDEQEIYGMTIDESPEAVAHKKAFERAERLRALKRPDVLLPEKHGDGSDRRNKLLAQCFSGSPSSSSTF